MTFIDGIEKVDVPEGFYAHAIGWRTTDFIVSLKDPARKVTSADFTWKWYVVGDYEYQVIDLKEEVGTLEFECSWDGRL